MTKEKTALSLVLIKSYGFPEKITKPDWDDVDLEVTLPNGLQLSCLTACGNEPCKCDTLYRLDGFLEIESKEQLDRLLTMTFEDIVNEVAESNNDFNIEDWL